MPCISTALSSALPQNVHGPKPSLTHMTFPQFKQLGTAASRGCRVPIQLHFRFSLSCKVPFVLISSVRIAASSSVSTVDAPCMDVPPVMLTFVRVGAGEAVREALREALLLLGFRESDIREPAAEGGGRGVGACTASGLGLSVKALLAAGRLAM